MPGLSAVERAPVEIWERILLEITEINPLNTPFFFAHCSPAAYLAFKRTSGFNEASIHPYKVIERTRLTLRLVCKSWKAVADRRHIRGKWIRWENSASEIVVGHWKEALRIDITKTAWARGWWFRQRRMAYIQSGECLPVQRLEVLHTRKGIFESLFSDLCLASAALPHLRSLTLHITETTPNTLSRISEHFPRLIHLTLFANERTFGFEPHDSLTLDNLETLFLFFQSFTYEEGLWNLPSLQHIHIWPINKSWENGFLPLLQQYRENLKTIDLDDTTMTGADETIHSSSINRIFPVDFWTSFPQLELLRCSVNKCKFQNYPIRNSSMRFLVNTDPIDVAHDFISTIQPWLDGDERKVLESIVLFGTYLSRKQHLYDRGVVEELILQLRSRAIKLTSPSGRSWIENV